MATSITYPGFEKVLDEIQNLNRWILETIGPYVKGRTLEIGSETNSLCPLFIKYNRPIHLSDASQAHLKTLRETWKGNRLVRGIHDLDFMTPDFQRSHQDMADVFDTVLALNLSMSDFSKMVDNLKFVLPSAGTLAMIWPAYTYIYNGLDQNLDDWYRYNIKSIRQILPMNFSILNLSYLTLFLDTAKYFGNKNGLSILLVVQKN